MDSIRQKLKIAVSEYPLSALQVKGELQDYYDRKLKEGKAKMLIINAARSKLIHRVCAIVGRGQKYNKNYAPDLA